MNKFLIVGVCFAVVAVSAGPGGPNSEEYMSKKYFEECKAETGGSIDDFLSVLGTQTPTEKGWCLTGCLNRKSGSMGPDNKIVWDKSLQELAPLKEKNPEFYANYLPALQQCKDQIESDAANLATSCTASKALGECVRAKMD